MMAFLGWKYYNKFSCACVCARAPACVCARVHMIPLEEVALSGHKIMWWGDFEETLGPGSVIQEGMDHPGGGGGGKQK